MRKTRKMLLAMTPADYDALKRDAGDCPLGPWIVQRALVQSMVEPGDRPPATQEPARPPASPAEWRTRMAAALDATDAVVAVGSKLPLTLGPVRAALVALRGAVRTS